MKIFADGPALEDVGNLAIGSLVEGFTTNPTLLRKAGVTNYERYARSFLGFAGGKPVSFEVLADTPTVIFDQARRISGWGDNVYVKVPVTTTTGESLARTVYALLSEGVKVNVTAIFTVEQAWAMLNVIERCEVPCCLSVFAGRIADAGVDPVPIIAEVSEAAEEASQGLTEVIWASPREVLNVGQAGEAGCHIITLTGDLIAKLPLIGKSLEAFSLETVEMFHRDALEAGLTL